MTIKKIATLVVSALMLTCCTLFLAGCGGSDYKYSGIEPGTYLFEKKSCTSFIDIQIDGTDNQKFESVQTSTEITIKVSPKRYHWFQNKDLFSGTSYRDIEAYKFDDCNMTYDIDINGETHTHSFYLDSNGNYEETLLYTFDPTYSLKIKCNLSDATGEVYAPMRDKYVFDYDGVRYITTGGNGNSYACELKPRGVGSIACYNKNYKNLTFHSSVFTPEGTELNFYLSSILSRRSILYFFDAAMTGTKTICLKGTYYISSVNTVFSSLKTYFPNLEKFAIEDLQDDGYASESCAFPESGVTIYLPDTNSEFAKSLKETFFVNDVKPYSEFSEV